MTHFEQLERHLLDEVLVFANLIQIPAVILTGGVAWLVCRPIRRWVKLWVERVPEHHHLDWVVSHRSWVTDRLVGLITPVAWVIGLWISVAVAERAGWPHAVTRTAVDSLLAWLVIRLAAALVPYAALTRLIAVLAWLVAAPNALIMAFGESAIELELRFWIQDAQNGVHNVKSQVLYAIWRLFQQQAFAFRIPSGIFMYARMRWPLLPRWVIGDSADREALGGATLTHQALRAWSPLSRTAGEGL